ncbi:hypothetical protein HHK36_014152 [Tetracentron sinense]|uniref:Nuclease HARBI1 n=1 Tax=Tetracentron sinense TaxID=13715 RepID=A0A835DI04_TETSI|nr:hypothetical protein HHK36_014152 [Tetracentron sinense]
MDRNLLNNMFFGDLEESDEEFEILTIACMEEERLNKEKQSRRHHGSIQGHRVIWRDRVQGHERLFQDYFAETPITAAMRMLAYGVASDYVDEYVRISESTAIESLKKSVHAVVASFSDEYLRPPNNNDIARLLAVGEHLNYSVNGNDYAMGYYLADESARKDVEHAFGVLQTRFAIVRGPARFWKCETLKDIMKACIIMHNMIVEDKRDVNGTEDFNYDAIDESPHAPVSHERVTELMEFIQGIRRIRDMRTHSQLQSDLVEHLWQQHCIQANVEKLGYNE